MRWVWIALASGSVCGFVLALVLIENKNQAHAAKPSLEIPAKSVEEIRESVPEKEAAVPGIDLSRRHTIVVRTPESPEAIVYADALFLGRAPAYRMDGKNRVPEKDFFKDWVAIELKDGRYAYCPESAIERLESPAKSQEGRKSKENGPVRY